MNMRMDKVTEFKLMLNKMCNHLSKESAIGVNYQDGEEGEYVFTFHGNVYGTVEYIFEQTQINRLGEEIFKGHMRAIRNALLDAELRTTKRFLNEDWGRNER